MLAGRFPYPQYNQGYNRFSQNSDYAIYNGGSYTAYAEYCFWWGTYPPPPSSLFYGDVDYSNGLTYDPTLSGAQSQTAPSQPEAMDTGTKSQSTTTATTGAAASPSGGTTMMTPGTVPDNVRRQASERVNAIYKQLSANPDDPRNYRLLQEAYSLVRRYDLADSTGLLARLDNYGLQLQLGPQPAPDNTGSGGKITFANAQPVRTGQLSQAQRRMGSTAVLLKMDYLLHAGQWNQAQNLAKRFAPYLQQPKDKESFLASRAVAWEHQGQFAKALAAYQQIDAMQPTSPPAGYVAPDYSFIEAELKDSMKVHSQASVAVASSGAATHLEGASQLEQLPKKFSVGHNYPNPFNPTTVIPVNLPKAAHVRVVVYNITGQRVATLTDREYQAGRYDLRFDAHQLASGVYFIRANMGEKTFTRRMTLIK